MHQKELDLIVLGATGFTGRLVAQYLHHTYGRDGELRWALAGRAMHKLQELHAELGLRDTVALIETDATDPEQALALAGRTRLVLTTMGPYQQLGEAIVRACAQVGTDYVDLCGEPAWMAEMIPKLTPLAQSSGARIVFSCGFDSIPFDLGVWLLQHEAQQRWGHPLSKVEGRVQRMKGGLSGGTLASAVATVERMTVDPQVRRAMSDPFALTPGFRGPRQPFSARAQLDPVGGQWSSPFMMAPINTKNIHRTHALLGHPWGQDFVYDERQAWGEGDAGCKRAMRAARRDRIQGWLLAWRPSRRLLQAWVLPKPGEGPDELERESGSFSLSFKGRDKEGRHLSTWVSGQRDPGYGSTCRMISEAALCLLEDMPSSELAGGVWTPAAAMGGKLLRRLQTHAGMKFETRESL